MTVEFLFDTNIFIDHLRGARPLPPIIEIAYSTLTRCELFAGHERDEPVIEALLAAHVEIDVDRLIAERAGRLVREMKLKVVDAVIAATAIERDLVLITRDRRDFDRVADLRLGDPATTFDT